MTSLLGRSGRFQRFIPSMLRMPWCYGMKYERIGRTLIERNDQPFSAIGSRDMAKEKKREEFIADRVRALATVYLTRRDDLIITDVDRSEGFDLRVQLSKEKGRAFGVVLTGAWKSTDA